MALILLGPALYFGFPYHYFSPDILYVKAKTLQVAAGHLFADPVSGYNTMHPPFYHLFLALAGLTGLNPDSILFAVIIFNVTLMLFLAYKCLEIAFDKITALITCLMFPFMMEYMGCSGILLATAFFFSVPFYLAGLWLFLKPPDSRRRDVAVAVLWGVAFLISPVYLFTLFLTFLYEAFVRKRFQRCLLISGIFSIIIIPFIVQLITVYAQGLGGARAFGLWRGIPDWHWWLDFIGEFISPNTPSQTIIMPPVIHAVILTLAMAAIIRAKRAHRFVIIFAVAYFLTFYHFSGQYAIRIQLFFSLFLVATAVSGLRRLRLRPVYWVAPLMITSAISVVHHYSFTAHRYKEDQGFRSQFMLMSRLLWSQIEKYLEPDKFIFCEKNMYRNYIMPYYRVHALGAYKTLDYYQLSAPLADMMERDYLTAMRSDSLAIIDDIAAKYRIETAIISNKEFDSPLFKALQNEWTEVYRDTRVVVMKRPAPVP